MINNMVEALHPTARLCARVSIFWCIYMRSILIFLRTSRTVKLRDIKDTKANWYKIAEMTVSKRDIQCFCRYNLIIQMTHFIWRRTNNLPVKLFTVIIRHSAPILHAKEQIQPIQSLMTAAPTTETSSAPNLLIYESCLMSTIVR